MSFVYLVFGSRCLIMLRVNSLKRLKLGNMQLMLGFKELSINLLGELSQLRSLCLAIHRFRETPCALIYFIYIYLPPFGVALERGNQE